MHNRRVNMQLMGCSILLSAVVGCSAQPRVPDKMVATLAELTYPAQSEYGPDLDVVVVRNHRSIELANRTASRYLHVQLWLNRHFVHRVEDLAIGTNNTFSLHQFINHHGESFPLETFLKPEQAFPVALAELYDPDTAMRHRLIVRSK